MVQISLLIPSVLSFALSAFAQLHTAAQAAGKLYFGSATDNPELTDTAYVAILSNASEFGQITPGNAMKWDATEPSQGSFSFTNAQEVVDLAQGNGQILRGHTCVWHSQLPSWVSSGNFDSSSLTSVIETHCSTVVGNWAGEIFINRFMQCVIAKSLGLFLHLDSWDVVNEPFNEDGTYRTSVFYNTLGTDYISVALKSARSADPNAKLYVNDYNIEAQGSKATGMISLVQSLLSEGVPIDGIGLQAHLIVGSVPTTIQANLEAMTALGVEVAITELDIRMTLPATDEKLQQQKTDYESVVAACANVEGCVGITIWDYTDKYSWVPSTFSGQGAALPWDDNLEKKPAYDGILAGLQNGVELC